MGGIFEGWDELYKRSVDSNEVKDKGEEENDDATTKKKNATTRRKETLTSPNFLGTQITSITTRKSTIQRKKVNH